jgi:hypothetical protein
LDDSEQNELEAVAGLNRSLELNYSDPEINLRESPLLTYFQELEKGSKPHPDEIEYSIRFTFKAVHSLKFIHVSLAKPLPAIA